MKDSDNTFNGKKIGLVGPGIMSIPPSGWGAVEILIWDYYLELKKKNVDVHIINKIRSSDKEQRDLNSKYIKELLYEINNGNFDFIHIHYDVLFHISKYINCKVGLTSHYPYIDNISKHKSDGFVSIFNDMINNNHLNFVLAEKDKMFLESYGAKNCHLLENGVSRELFSFCDKPDFLNKTIYLGRVTPRKRQHIYCSLNNIDIIGPGGEHLPQNWKGAWNRKEVYENLSKYGNMLLISEGEADPLVIKEALICGLGVVVNETSCKNFKQNEFITVIEESKINDLSYIQQKMDENREKSITIRSKIAKYGYENFGWNKLIDNYLFKICK
tara:strand:+ start:251 stop:1237 length:987 start_codon:yes stop_codon:yes gene_type:complete